MSAQNQRVVCMRCGVNNFVGQPTCWRCHASLPPPDALPNIAPKRSGRYVRALAVAVVLMGVAVLVCLMVYVAGVRNNAVPVGAGDNPQLRALQQKRDRMINRPTPGISDVHGLDRDTPLARAERRERELEQKLRDRTGTEMPNASPAAPGGIVPPVP